MCSMMSFIKLGKGASWKFNNKFILWQSNKNDDMYFILLIFYKKGRDGIEHSFKVLYMYYILTFQKSRQVWFLEVQLIVDAQIWLGRSYPTHSLERSGNLPYFQAIPMQPVQIIYFPLLFLNISLIIQAEQQIYS